MKNGSGMPVIGIRFTVIPTFSNMWVKNSPEDAEHHQAAEGIGRPPGDPEQGEEEHEEEGERDEDPDEAQLLPDDREDEVGVLLRQERQPLLGPCGVSGPEPPAGADGHLRLDRLVAGPADRPPD